MQGHALGFPATDAALAAPAKVVWCDAVKLAAILPPAGCNGDAGVHSLKILCS
jgi:hypothetical protein